MIKYSFIIPVYNVENYLPKCLDSILAQSFPKENFELILIDDGSTDSSGIICDDYGNKNNNVTVIHQDNKSLLLARGAGVRNSNGKYLLFVDSDDYIEEHLLSVVDNYIERYNPDFLCFGFILESSDGFSYDPPIEGKYTELNKEEFLELFVASDSFNSVCSKVIRGSILRNGADEIYTMSTNMGEDKLQTAYLLQESNTIVMINDCLYHYIMRDSSIAHYKNEKDIYDIIEVYRKVEKRICNILDGFDQAVFMRDETLKKYKSVAINGTLEHVYKYNKRMDITSEDKKATLSRLLDRNRDFFSVGSDVIKLIRPYNKVRYKMFVKERFSQLVLLDYALQAIQRVMIRIKGQ